MTSQIRIDILHGSSSVTDEDRERAEAAALAVLGGANPALAYDEYQRQFAALDGIEGMTGAALLWDMAETAANIALTEGWHNPNGAACAISV